MACPLGTVPRTTISARTPLGDSAVSPPARVTPCCSASRSRPRKKRVTQDCGSLPGSARERKAATGSPPIAAMSLNPLARQRWPTDSGGCQFLRKWIPSRLKSVVTRQSKPDPIRKTAQSSPIPTGISASPLAGSRLLPVEATSRRSCAMSSLSGRGMSAINIPPSSDFDRNNGAAQLRCRNMSYGPCWLPHLP